MKRLWEVLGAAVFALIGTVVLSLFARCLGEELKLEVVLFAVFYFGILQSIRAGRDDVRRGQ